MNITISDITIAIDMLICKYDLLTEEDFAQGLGLSQMPFAKAAQAVMPRTKTNVNTIPFAPAKQNIEKQIIDMLQRGFSIKNISQQLRVTEDIVKEVSIKSGIGDTPTSRYQWYQNKYEKPVKDIVNKKIDNDGMINVKMIAEQLNVDKSMVSKVLENAGISVTQLVKERKQRMIEMLKGIAEELKNENIKYTYNTVAVAFKQKTNIDLKPTTFNRFSSLANIQTAYQRTDPFIKAIDYWVYGHRNLTIQEFINNSHKTKEQVFDFVHNVFNDIVKENGKNFGFDFSKPMDAAKLQELIMARLQAEHIVNDRDKLRKKPDYKNNEKYKNLQKFRIDPTLTREQFQEQYKHINKKVFKAMNWYKIAKEKEYENIPGGRAEEADMHPDDYDKKELENGTVIEYEHTGDKDTAMEIAMDHLREFQSYYKALAEMEQTLKDEGDKETTKN